MLCLWAGCANTIKTETLDYYKVALLSVDDAVKAGTKHAVDNLPTSCYKSDECVSKSLERWFSAIHAVQSASKFLQVAYMAPKDPDGIRALACAVVRLREVNGILMSASIELPKDYMSFFVFLDAQAKGMLCSENPEQENNA